MENTRTQIINLVKTFTANETGMGKIIVNDVPFTIASFKTGNRIFLSGVNDKIGGMPDVFAVSDGNRVMFKTSCWSDMHVVYDTCIKERGEGEETVFMQYDDVRNNFKQYLKDNAVDFCQRYIEKKYGDAEPMSSCECDENPEAAIAASYCCNIILAETGSFEELQRYINTDILNNIVVDKQPEYNVPNFFYDNVTSDEVIRFFMNDADDIAQLVKSRMTARMLKTYGEYAIRLVKWYSTRQQILEQDDNLRKIVEINKAIKTFLVDEKYEKATKLTYTVRDKNGRLFRFRMKRDVMLTSTGFSTGDAVYRVHGYCKPRYDNMRSFTPDDIEEIRYVKHAVYVKTA